MTLQQCHMQPNWLQFLEFLNWCRRLFFWLMALPVSILNTWGRVKLSFTHPPPQNALPFVVNGWYMTKYYMIRTDTLAAIYARLASVDRISFYTLATSEDIRHYIRLRGYTPWDSHVTISRYLSKYQIPI